MKKKISKKLISVILAVVMLAMSMPVAFAAEPIALSEANVVAWPTIEGEIYTGQKLSDGLTVTGGTVTTDGTSEGTVIPGKFEFINPDYISATTSEFADLKFIPENTTEFSGFEVENVIDVIYRVKTVTPVLVDENDPPVATSVSEAGKRLFTTKLSGGKVKNPVTGVELTAEWYWVSKATPVNESGYFTAELGAGTGYEVIQMDVYVSIAGDAPATKVDTAPSFGEVTYDPNLTWGSLPLTGGKAVISETGVEIEGAFAVSDDYKDLAITVGERTLPIVFTPNDPTVGINCICQVPVTVNKGTVKFVDEDGNEIVPEITLDRVLKVGNDLDGYLKPYLNASCSFNYEETEGYRARIKPGTHEYTVKTIIDDPNYERYGTLTFKVIANREKINAKVKNVVGGRQIYFDSGDVIHLYGDFDIKCFVDGKETQVIEGVKLNEAFVVNQSKSGVYTYEIIYNAAENDYYDVTVVTEAEEIKLQHSVKINDNEPVVYTYGDMVTIVAPAHEKPYYEFTGWSDISGITLTDDQRSAESISTTMPDNDIELKANYKFSLKLFFEWIWAKVVQFFTFIFNAIRDLFALAA